jgi:hypothetical protein
MDHVFIETKPDFATLHELMLHLHVVMTAVEDLGDCRPDDPKAIRDTAVVIDEAIKLLQCYTEEVLFIELPSKE